MQAIDPAPPPPASTLVAPSVTPAEAPASAPPPLDLRLPARSASQARNPALDDPRVISPRAALEDMIGAAMGDGRWVTERLDGDRLRLRNGPKCLELHRSRADQIDPIGARHSPKPWAAKSC